MTGATIRAVTAMVATAETTVGTAAMISPIPTT